MKVISSSVRNATLINTKRSKLATLGESTPRRSYEKEQAKKEPKD